MDLGQWERPAEGDWSESSGNFVLEVDLNKIGKYIGKAMRHQDRVATMSGGAFLIRLRRAGEED